MTDQREVRRYEWRLRATGDGFSPLLYRSGDVNDIPGFGKDFYAAADFDALKAERDELAAWRDRAVEACAKRECSKRDRLLAEERAANDVLKAERDGVQWDRDGAMAAAERLQAERDAALAEVDRLERIEIKYKNLCEVLNEQTALIERLRAALAIHGRHHHGCSWNGHWTTCDCGLIAALRGERKKP